MAFTVIRRYLLFLVFCLGFTVLLSSQTTIIYYEVDPYSQERKGYHIFDNQSQFEIPEEIQGFRLSENQKFIAVFHHQTISVVNTEDTNVRQDMRVPAGNFIISYEVTDKGDLVLSKVDSTTFLSELMYYRFGQVKPYRSSQRPGPMYNVVYNNSSESFAMVMEEPRSAVLFFDKELKKNTETDRILPYSIESAFESGFIILSGQSCCLIDEKGITQKEIFRIPSNEMFVSFYYDSLSSSCFYVTESEKGFSLYLYDIEKDHREFIRTWSDSVPILYAGIWDFAAFQQIMCSFKFQE